MLELKCVVVVDVTLSSISREFCLLSVINNSFISFVNLTLFFGWLLVFRFFVGFHFQFFSFCSLVFVLQIMYEFATHAHKDHPFNFLLILQHVVLLQLFLYINCTIALCFFCCWIFVRERIITVITNFTFCLRWTFVCSDCV